MPESFGRYRLVERLGSGGMAHVFRATVEGEFQRPLVIKRILPELSDHPDFVRLLQDEARLSARLDHRAIVRVYELGQVANEYFLAMEFIDGPDLASLLTSLGGRKLDPALACYLVHEVASALAYAHSLEIIHRDVSPSNILISKSGAVKLCDFGIAKAAGGIRNDKTRTGVVKGKVSYMSPEQADARALDQRSDLFSLGIVFWEGLSGRRLFRGDDDLHTLRLVREAEVAPPDCDPRIQAIVMKLLMRDREQRFASADEVIAALDPLLHEQRAGAPALQALVEELGPRPKTPEVASDMVTVAREQHEPQRETVQHQKTSRRRWPYAALLVIPLAAIGYSLRPRPVATLPPVEAPPVIEAPKVVEIPVEKPQQPIVEHPVAESPREKAVVEKPRVERKIVEKSRHHRVKRSKEIHDPFSER